MYKKTQRARDYGVRVASKSIRPFRGGWSDQGFEVIQSGSLAEQYREYERRAAECESAMTAIDAAIRDVTSSAERFNLRAERERFRRQWAHYDQKRGHLGKTLREAGQMQLERIFTRVAECRLHKDVFLSLMDEARDIWRASEDNQAIPPPEWNRQKKLLKLRAKTEGAE